MATFQGLSISTKVLELAQWYEILPASVEFINNASMCVA